MILFVPCGCMQPTFSSSFFVIDRFGLSALTHRYAELYVVCSFPLVFISFLHQINPEDKSPPLIGPDELRL